MNLTTKSDVKAPLVGVFLMIVFTSVWALIAEYALHDRDHRILGVVFGGIILTFVVFYVKSLSFMKTLPEQILEVNKTEESKKTKQFIIIGTVEGLSIFIVKNVLVNLNLDQYFISCMALIVGLHFFPLAKLFKNKFHLYMGYWTTLIATIGLVLTYTQPISTDLITAFVGVGCAITTTVIGTRLILVINEKRKLQLG